MNKATAITKTIILKAVCTALVFILGGSLFAAGAMGSDGCGMKCCCQTGPTHVQPAAGQQMQSPMGCCSGVPLSPCDIQSGRPFELPEIILAACCDDLSKAGWSAVILPDGIDRRSKTGLNYFSQALDLKVSSPPIYLQNLSFLI